MHVRRLRCQTRQHPPKHAIRLKFTYANTQAHPQEHRLKPKHTHTNQQTQTRTHQTTQQREKKQHSSIIKKQSIPPPPSKKSRSEEARARPRYQAGSRRTQHSRRKRQTGKTKHALGSPCALHERHGGMKSGILISVRPLASPTSSVDLSDQTMILVSRKYNHHPKSDIHIERSLYSRPAWYWLTKYPSGRKC